MIAASILAVTVVALNGGSEGVQASSALSSESSREQFARLVRDYQMSVTPLCAPDLAVAYRRFNHERDRAFVESLADTELESRHRAAVREWNEQERRTVRHCEGPPPPPPPPGSTAPPIDRRAFAIEETQNKLRRYADAVPRHFDEGDRVFARLVALRDEIIGDRDRQE